MWSTTVPDGPTPSEIGASLDSLAGDCLTGAFGWRTTAEVPTVFTAYFAARENRYWLTSQEGTNHVAGLRLDPICSLAIWRPPPEWGEPLRGVQLIGLCRVVDSEDEANVGIEALHERFPGTIETIPSSRAVLGESRRTTLLSLVMKRGVVRDEERFGKGKFPISWEEG